jgi:RNA polymerase sigma factor (sigma-70 family)
VVHHLRRVTRLCAGHELTDTELLERYAGGHDNDAFANLVRRYGRLVRSVCWRVLHHEQDTDDAFQAVFLILATRAASIHKTTALASWLYGVAFRTAMNAKRARLRQSREKKPAEGGTSLPPVSEASLREIQRLLDEEVNRLPDKYRAPFVLCCLGSTSKAEAARKLGCKEGTVSSRLAHARRELQKRLTRRGVALTAALCGIELSRAAAEAVPPALVSGTIKAALSFAATKTTAADLVSARVAALAKGAVPNMWTTKLKIATALLLAVSFVIGASWFSYQGLAAGPQAKSPRGPTRKASAGPKAPATPRGDSPQMDPAKTVMIQGRVLDATGQPVPGAKVCLWSNVLRKVTLRAATEKDGRFRFSASQAVLASGGLVIGMARGHGPDWKGLGKAGKTDDVSLRLPRDDVPIQGRVLDLEGHAIAGATVHVTYLEKRMEEGDLTPWIETKRKWARGNYVPGVAMTGIGTNALDGPTTVTTGKDGGFRLAGFGRERVVFLEIRGPDIETTHVEVMTRRAPVTSLPAESYAATFRHLVGPSKVIMGTVRDKRTRKPLAGIKVAGGASPGGNSIGATRQVDGVTDAQGTYRLTGIGKYDHYWVAAAGAAYFNATRLGVKDTAGLDPVIVDFDLEQGIVVKGRLTDKATGKPIKGHVSALALADNPHVKDFAGLNDLQVLVTDWGRVQPDGSFATLAIPGPGLLCVQAENADHYIGFEIKDWDGFLLRTAPGGRHPSSFNAVIPINPTEDNPRSTTCNVALEPGRVRHGTITGPDGKPVADVHVAGLTPVPRFYPLPFPGQKPAKRKGLDTAGFTVLGLNPRKPRALVFFHPEEKLGKVEQVRGDEEGPLTVHLEPLGSLTGRVVDAQGKPWAGLQVKVELTRLITAYKDLPWEVLDKLGPVLTVVQTTDRDGKFRIEGLLPGLKYNLVVTEEEIRPGVRIIQYLENVSVKPGKTLKAGDLKSKLTPKTKERK